VAGPNEPGAGSTRGNSEGAFPIPHSPAWIEHRRPGMSHGRNRL
jgi:hypothetical protein